MLETDLLRSGKSLLRALTRRHLLQTIAHGAALALLWQAAPAAAQTAKETLIVAGPRTPESLDQEYPPNRGGA